MFPATTNTGFAYLLKPADCLSCFSHCSVSRQIAADDHSIETESLQKDRLDLFVRAVNVCEGNNAH